MSAKSFRKAIPVSPERIEAARRIICTYQKIDRVFTALENVGVTINLGKLATDKNQKRQPDPTCEILVLVLDLLAIPRARARKPQIDIVFDVIENKITWEEGLQLLLKSSIKSGSNHRDPLSPQQSS